MSKLSPDVKPKSLTCNNLYERGKYYAVTVNPDDQHQYCGKPDRIQRVRNMYYDTMVSWAQYKIDYKFYTEISEPKMINGGIGPRVHLHGWVKFNSNKGIKKFLCDELYKLSRGGIVDIDTIDDLVIWEKYITKQQHIIQLPPLTNLFIGDNDPEGTGAIKKNENQV